MGLDLIPLRWVAAALAALLLVNPLSAQSPNVNSDLEKIRSLGPWPPATVRDSSNRVSGNALAIELGRQLFFDPRMSPIGYIACVTCHQPDRAFSDLKPRAHGLADLDRNTIALANLGSLPWYGWIGASHQLGASAAAFSAGANRTMLGDYQVAFWAAGLLCVVAGLSFLTIGRSLRPAPVPVVATAG